MSVRHSPDSEQYLDGLRRRRRAALREPPLPGREHLSPLGQRDPWVDSRALQLEGVAWREAAWLAWGHLAAVGLGTALVAEVLGIPIREQTA